MRENVADTMVGQQGQSTEYSYLSPADACIVEQMVAWYGLPDMVRELAMAADGMRGGRRGWRRQALLDTHWRLSMIAEEVEKAALPS